ncbi:AraC family transcriptional regulator [Paraburkholderia strydomiana]
MDLLSRLLVLLPVAGRVDVRCHFGSPWSVAHEPAGFNEIPYHVLVRGAAVLEDGSGPSETLATGDIVIFPNGQSHTLHDGSGRPPVPIAKQRSASFVVAENGADGAKTDILCGRFLLGAVPDRLLREHLPGRLVVHTCAKSKDFDSLEAVNGSLDRLISLMREEVDEPRPGSEALLNHLSGALFALALRYAGESPRPPRGLLALAARPRLQPAASAMFDSPQKPWTLEQLAAACSMSRATFVRQFRETIGRSATDVLTDIRMTIAGKELLQSRKSTAEIAETVGYQSEAAFQRIFKRLVGMSPARWRSVGRANS